ncbi:MAG: PilZ domain-containing protein [Magnetococcus sp. XQGC-1]
MMANTPQDTPASEERRLFSRVDFRHLMTFVGEDGSEYAGAFDDISLKGLLFWSTPLPAKGEKLSGLLQLGDVEIRLAGTVIHSHQNRGAAVLFQSLDVDSFSHLRRLVSLNMGDSETIDKEFFSSL